MQTFKEITDRLKTILNTTKDKDLATALGIKPTTFASMKRRDKTPHKAILTYCHDNLIDANTVLLGEIELDDPIVPEIEGKIVVKYFQSIEAYALYLKISK